MQIKYAGPKPIISHKCINFDNNKEDKYVYLQVALELYRALDHDYFEDKTYTYQASEINMSDEQLNHKLQQLCPNLYEIVDKRAHIVEEDYDEHIDRAHDTNTLTEEEKSVLINNIKLMHEYIVQRSVNKAAYYCVIDELAELLKKEHIDYIITPMIPKYVHVLHSLQGSLNRQKFPIDTSLDIYKKDEALMVKLKVKNKL
jgi:hypothetical protein